MIWYRLKIYVAPWKTGGPFDTNSQKITHGARIACLARTSEGKPQLLRAHRRSGRKAHKPTCLEPKSSSRRSLPQSGPLLQYSQTYKAGVPSSPLFAPPPFSSKYFVSSPATAIPYLLHILLVLACPCLLRLLPCKAFVPRWPLIPVVEPRLIQPTLSQPRLTGPSVDLPRAVNEVPYKKHLRPG